MNLIFCDESRPELLYSERAKKDATYFSLGGIWLPKEEKEKIKSKIKYLRNKHNIKNEFKWNSVSPSKIDFYFDLVDLFFKEDGLQFRALIVDSNKVDMEKYHKNDSELGFYKFYYQLLHHKIKNDNEYAIYLDQKKNKDPDRLNVLHDVLQNANPWSVIYRVQAIASHQSEFIQLADLFMGAINYKYNEINSSEAKLNLIYKIESYLGMSIGPTPSYTSKFNIFHIWNGGN
ncbi:Protein of unknown function [Salinibacillus kushneri]|uniref:DUF3800 domain-containing protein n=1 Tax=Salinibacillus kushneri TaxID=237682 RepID=A0A1I0B7W3_9BACI|nr:DUF3800 domain-containing protein [Salinibacillus kushneri]SET02842.1 Protein of unknown function [Salinibacillus kushneri]